MALCPDCNVIVFTASSLRADRLSLYGYQRETDQALAKWMKHGIVFDHHYTVGKWPFQTLMSGVTGLSPEKHEVLLNSYHNDLNFGPMRLQHDRLSDDKKMIAELMKENNYTTAFWGGRPHPSFYSPTAGYARGIDHFVGKSLHYHTDLPELFQTFDKIKDKKFFFNINTIRSHFPHFVLPKNFTRKFQNKNYNGPLPRNEEEYYDIWLKCFKQKSSECPINFNTLSQKKLDSVRFSTDLYALLQFSKRDDNVEDELMMEDYNDDSIAFTDVFIDEIFRYLERNDLLKKTIVIFTADLGTTINDRYSYGNGTFSDVYFGYGSFQEEVLKIPLVVYLPDRAELKLPQQRIDAITNTTDIVPTILNITGVKSNSSFDGESLVPLLTGEKDKIRDYTFGLSFRPQRGVETFIRNKDFIATKEKRGYYGIDVKTKTIIPERRFSPQDPYPEMIKIMDKHFGPMPVKNAEEIRLKFNNSFEPYKY